MITAHAFRSCQSTRSSFGEAPLQHSFQCSLWRPWYGSQPMVEAEARIETVSTPQSLALVSLQLLGQSLSRKQVYRMGSLKNALASLRAAVSNRDSSEHGFSVHHPSRASEAGLSADQARSSHPAPGWRGHLRSRRLHLDGRLFFSQRPAQRISTFGEAPSSPPKQLASPVPPPLSGILKPFAATPDRMHPMRHETVKRKSAPWLQQLPWLQWSLLLQHLRHHTCRGAAAFAFAVDSFFAAGGFRQRKICKACLDFQLFGGHRYHEAALGNFALRHLPPTRCTSRTSKIAVQSHVLS